MIQALLFDFDGLIADTESAVYETWLRTYTEHGAELPIEEWAECVGSDWGKYDPEKRLEELCGRSLDWEQLRPRMKRFEAGILEDLQPFPGVRPLLEQAKEAELGLAVASSSPHEWVDRWLQQFELEDCFQTVVCLDDVGKAKPDPGLFLEAARRLERDPGECLVLEDSLNGMRAAHAAGMPCCIVPNSITRHFDFSEAEHCLSSLQEILDRGLGDFLEANPR